MLRGKQRAGFSPTARARRLVYLLALAVLVILDYDYLTIGLFQAGEDQRPIRRVCFDPGWMVADVDLREKPERGWRTI